MARDTNCIGELIKCRSDRFHNFLRIRLHFRTRNIAQHIESDFSKRAKNWRPLVYCWRGGKRSSAMGHILRQIGWDAHVLEGGYKTYRAQVVQDLKSLPVQFKFQVISGRTGSAKSRVLEELAVLGCQVLHLEALANHKGSVLGAYPHDMQPSQKYFESQIVAQLKTFDCEQVIFIEAESKIVPLHTINHNDTVL